MEYRLRYRDIPWTVAIMTLPCKIVGTLIGKPIDYINEDPFRFFMKALKKLFWAIVITVVFVLLMGLMDMSFNYRLGFVKNGDRILMEWKAEREARAEEKRRAEILRLANEYRRQMFINTPGECLDDSVGRCR